MSALLVQSLRKCTKQILLDFGGKIYILAPLQVSHLDQNKGVEVKTRIANKTGTPIASMAESSLIFFGECHFSYLPTNTAFQ